MRGIRVKHRSFSDHRVTLGRLINGKVELGRKFLRGDPQYQNVELKFRDNKLLPVQASPVSLSIVQSVLNHTEALHAGACYVLGQIAKQAGITKTLKKIFPQSWQELLSLAMFMTIHPDASIFNYDVIAKGSLFPSGAIAAQRVLELFESVKQPSIEQYLKLRVDSSKKLIKTVIGHLLLTRFLHSHKLSKKESTTQIRRILSRPDPGWHF